MIPLSISFLSVGSTHLYSIISLSTAGSELIVAVVSFPIFALSCGGSNVIENTGDITSISIWSASPIVS